MKALFTTLAAASAIALAACSSPAPAEPTEPVAPVEVVEGEFIEEVAEEVAEEVPAADDSAPVVLTPTEESKQPL